MPDGSVAECYAKTLAESGVAKAAYPHGFEHHYWRPEALRSLTAGDEPLLIFCDSMSDLFAANRSEEHTSELQSQSNLVCRLLLEKKKLLIVPRTFPTPLA